MIYIKYNIITFIVPDRSKRAMRDYDILDINKNNLNTYIILDD